MQTYNIVIIGLGQLGSRHLQSLANLDGSATIYLVDQSSESLEKAAELFRNSKPSNLLELKLHTSISSINVKTVDVAIVATTSLVRRAVVEELAKQCVVKYLVLEKFLFPKLEDYEAVEKILKEKNIGAWVNCTRRMYPIYKQLKEKLTTNTAIIFSGSNWGLGCNGIHLLDLSAFLSGQKRYKLNHTLIDKEVIKSKRDGYIEFTGTITGYSNNQQSLITLTSYLQESIPFTITIQCEGKHYIIVESQKKIITIDINSQTITEESIVIPFQSQLTSIVVNNLLNTGTCELTEYEESKNLHYAYLDTLIKSLHENSNIETAICQIT